MTDGGEFVVRPMRITDVDAVAGLAEEVAEAPRWGRGEYIRYAGTGSDFFAIAFVVEVAGVMAGFVLGRVVAAGLCELESIAVRGEMRGRGLGAALLSAFSEAARSVGAGRIELEVRASNVAAIRLYERAGATVDGRRARYYSAPEEDGVLMSLTL